MEACEEEHLNDSISNSDEKQSCSFNSSELDDAMNELLTQESQNDLETTNEDLSDLLDEKIKTKDHTYKLKFRLAQKIVRRAKHFRKKNFYFLNRYGTKNLLRVNHNEPLHSLDNNTSQKIKNVVNSGNLTIQGLNSQTSFPKAIVYPDTKKLNAQSIKSTDPTKMSFNEVFTKAAEEQVKSQKSIDQAEAKKARNKFKLRVPPSKLKDNNKTETIEKEPFKYLIPQNLLASKNDKTGTNSSKNDSNASTSKSHNNSTSSEEKLDYTHSTIPERPQINYDLIDALADYRVIARYLFNKLNVPAIDFDGTDDYINLYKLSRN